MMGRTFHKFTSMDGTTIEAIFPRASYTDEVDTPLRNSYANVAGAHYGVRLIGAGPALKDFGSVRIGFDLVGSTIDAVRDELHYKLHAIGQGKLWAKSFVADGHGEYSEAWRWCVASLKEMPRVSMSYQQRGQRYTVILGFVVESDFYGDPVSVVQNVTTNGQEWTVANPGLPNDQVTITLRPLSNSGINAPTITNLTTGSALETSFQSASTSDRLRLVTRLVGGPKFEASDDAGVSWDTAYQHYVTPPITQASLTFRLAPGNNTFKLDGVSPNVEVAVSFFERVS